MALIVLNGATCNGPAGEKRGTMVFPGGQFWTKRSKNDNNHRL